MDLTSVILDVYKRDIYQTELAAPIPAKVCSTFALRVKNLLNVKVFPGNRICVRFSFASLLKKIEMSVLIKKKCILG